MSKKEKLVKRLQSNPKDFTFDELVVLLNYLGYESVKAGKTSGSRVTFMDKEGYVIRLHKPHPRNVLKSYQVSSVIEALRERGVI